MTNLFWSAAVAAFAVVMSGSNPSGATKPSPQPTTIADFVRAVLPDAVNDFASLLGARARTYGDTQYAAFAMRVSDAICHKCRAVDYYGVRSGPEQWAVSNHYMEDGAELVQLSYVLAQATVPSPSPSALPGASAPPIAGPPSEFLMISPTPEWPIAQTEAYVKAQLASLLTGFSLKKTTAEGMAGETTTRLMWHGPHRVWLLAELYPHSVGGLLKVYIRVGHDVPNGVHVLRPATKAQLEQLRADVSRFIRVTVPATARAFADLRGKEISRSRHEYAITTSFAPAFRDCSIFDIAARSGKSWDPKSIGRWDLTCSTIPTLGSRASEEDIVRSAIGAALPRGFYPVSVAKHYEDDYRWQNGKGVIVEIDRGDMKEDIVSFHLSIRH